MISAGVKFSQHITQNNPDNQSRVLDYTPENIADIMTECPISHDKACT
jgi:hypothetical protein